nr:unnamed protein product [Callosobruchus analis]
MEGSLNKTSSKLAEPLYGRSKKIYVFENGDRYSKCFASVINPKVFKTWRHILQYLTEKMMPSFGPIENLINLKTLEKITCFEELEIEEKYVALGPNDISKKYFFEETEKRGLTVIFVMPNGGSQEPRKFVFSLIDLANVKPVEMPPKKAESLTSSFLGDKQAQSILRLNESAIEENLVLPDTNVTLFKDALESKTKSLREQVAGMLATPEHLNECVADICGICDPKGTECPDCMAMCHTIITPPHRLSDVDKERSPSTRMIHANLMHSLVSEIHPATVYGIREEAPCHKRTDSEDESTECETLGKDPDLDEEAGTVPKTIKENSSPVVRCSDTCSNYRKHGTPCLICECAHKNSELSKTPSLRKSSPSRHSVEQVCDANCEYFRKTGIQYPHCRCDEVDNILQLVILEAQTLMGHCDKKESPKDSNDSCPKKSNQTKTKDRKKADCGISIDSPGKPKLKKPNKLAACSCQPDKKTKTPSTKGSPKKKNEAAKDKKSCKRDMSIDSLETDDVVKKRIDNKTKKCTKKKKIESPGTNNNKTCSANAKSFKLAVECKTIKFSDRNIGAKRSDTKCSSMKALDRISESSSKTTNTTSEADSGCGNLEEASVKQDSACPIIYEASSSCEVKEELLQELTHIAVGIEDQHCCAKSVTTIQTQIEVVSQSCKTTSPPGSNMIECSGACDTEEEQLKDVEEDVEQLKETPEPKCNPPSCYRTDEEHVEESIDETVEQIVEQEDIGKVEEKCVEDEDKVCSGCLSVTCQCGGRFGGFCDCDTSAEENTYEPEKYILICDSTCDFLRRTGASCPVCKCDSCNEEDDVEDDHVKTNLCYDDCYEEILSDISEDSLESCCVVKAVKEEMRLIKKARCLSVEDVYKASKNKKCRQKESCCLFPSEVQGIRIKNKMDVNFYGASGAKHHYSKTKKYKSSASSNFIFVSEPSTPESDRISSQGGEGEISPKAFQTTRRTDDLIVISFPTSSLAVCQEDNDGLIPFAFFMIFVDYGKGGLQSVHYIGATISLKFSYDLFSLFHVGFVCWIWSRNGLLLKSMKKPT